STTAHQGTRFEPLRTRKVCGLVGLWAGKSIARAAPPTFKTALVRPGPRARPHAEPRRRHGGVGRASAAGGPRPEPPTNPPAPSPSTPRGVASARTVGTTPNTPH